MNDITEPLASTNPDPTRTSAVTNRVAASVGQSIPTEFELPDQIAITELYARLWRGRVSVLAGMVLFFLLGALYLHVTPVRYTALLQTTSASLAPRGAGTQSAVSTFASLAGITGASAASPFDLYLATLTSRAVAEDLARDKSILRVVFAHEVDGNGWRQPTGGIGSVRDAVFHSLGISTQPWHAPDAARLQDYLTHALSIGRESASSPITDIRLTHTDPHFAAVLLNRLNIAADDRVRRADLARATTYIAYLNDKLKTVTVAEQRIAIVGILAEQERQAMIASSGLSYAAETIEPASVPTAPSSLTPSVVLIGATIAGAIVGAFVVLLDLRLFNGRRNLRRTGT